MYSSNYHGSNYYASAYYAALRGDLEAFNRLTTRDVQYEALRLVVSNSSDTRTMEKEYWLDVLGGSSRMSTADIMYEGIVLVGGFPTLKDYYDTQTSNIWPDHNSSEKAYWLKIIADTV